jgi:hypothetical protein
MEDSAWLSHLLDASRVALERVRDPKLDVDPALEADLERLGAELERQLADLGRSPEPLLERDRTTRQDSVLHS